GETLAGEDPELPLAAVPVAGEDHRLRFRDVEDALRVELRLDVDALPVERLLREEPRGNQEKATAGHTPAPQDPSHHDLRVTCMARDFPRSVARELFLAAAGRFFAGAGVEARKTSFMSGSLPAGFSNPHPPLSHARTLPPLRSRSRRYGLPQLGHAS